MKTIILASALLFSPLQVNEEVEPIEETTEVTENETTNTEEVPNSETTTSEEVEKLDKAIETIEWFKTLLTSLGIGVGAISGTTLISLIIVALRSLSNSLKLKKSNRETLASVKESILSELETSVDKEVKEKIEPVLNQVVKVLENTKDLQAVLTKIVALSQSNTPESKLAILECIASLGVVNKEVIEEKKEEIIEEDKKEQETIESAKETLEEIIQETEVPNIII